MSSAAAERYAAVWDATFDQHVAAYLRPGAAILDVGSGARPVVPRCRRPAGSHYVGLDISAEELEKARDQYDELCIADVADRIPEFTSRFDLVLSWQVLEHVRSTQDALFNLRAYLKPEGVFVAQLSGRYALFAIVNRLIPERVGVLAMSRLLQRDPESVFRAHYDGCSYSALSAVFRSGWSEVEITPRYRGAAYLRFAAPLQRLYLVYEDWAARSNRFDLATHYVVKARPAALPRPLGP